MLERAADTDGGGRVAQCHTLVTHVECAPRSVCVCPVYFFKKLFKAPGDQNCSERFTVALRATV